jgi:hypothetical protein
VQDGQTFAPAAAVDPANVEGLFVVWLNRTYAVNDLYPTDPMASYGQVFTDRDGSDMNLSNYIVQDSEVVMERSVDGNPARLTFTLAQGHLFDPNNVQSLLNKALNKGRILQLRFGEKINNVNYWVNQGRYVITETRLSYEKGKYTDASVVAEDERTLWQNHHIVTTGYFSNYPEDVIESLLTDHTDMVAADFNITDFDNRVVVDHQWVDLTLDDALKQICNRFGYFYRFQLTDNRFTCGKVWNHNAIGHTYSTYNMQTYDYRVNPVIRYEPDDTFSDFTNRVTVTGQERTWIDVTYPEERVKTIHGTFGWYGYETILKSPTPMI